jgi:hypothetical protein
MARLTGLGALAVLLAASLAAASNGCSGGGGGTPAAGGRGGAGVGGGGSGGAGTGGGACTSVPVGSCAHDDGSACEEWSGSAVSNAGFMADCQGRAGRTFSSSPCLRGGSIGACQADVGGCLTTWLYPPADKQVQKAGCESAGGTWLDPGGIGGGATGAAGRNPDPGGGAAGTVAGADGGTDAPGVSGAAGADAGTDAPVVSGVAGADGGSDVPVSSDGGSGDAASIAVHGKVTNALGQPLANQVVALLGTTTTATTDALGAFTFNGVASPYDLTIADATRKIAVTWRGITRTDPVLLFIFGKEPAAFSMTVSGTLTGAVLSGAGTLSVDLSAGGDFLRADRYAHGDGSQTFSKKLTWDGDDTISATIHVLETERDAQDLPMAYPGYGRLDLLAVTSGVDKPNQALALNPVGTGSVAGSVAGLAGYQVGASLFIHFDAGAFVSPGTQPAGAAGAAVPFSFLSPDIAGTTLTVLAAGTTAGGALGVRVYKTVKATESGVAITLPAAAAPTTPAEGATGVARAAAFAWTPVAKAVYIANVTAGGVAHFIYTTQSTATVPDLSAFGGLGALALPASTAGTWSVAAYGPVTSIDEALTSVGVPAMNAVLLDTDVTTDGFSTSMGTTRAFTTGP